ncbi:MAG: hypothetical protein DRP45_04220 [Candidatus Zixiibacteriota bacterium]|nr:MAG: hypothetical protein DRP45_04220 [candidate division Zixibacteria bacterium]
MRKVTFAVAASIVILVSTVVGQVPVDRFLSIHHHDKMEIKFSSVAGVPDTTFLFGSVVLETKTATIYCDTAVYAWGSDIILKGRVMVDGEDFQLAADSTVLYNVRTNQGVAHGDYVELWSRPDSILAVGRHAFFDRDRDYFYMLERPTLYLNYPDSANMIEVIADFIERDGVKAVAEATGDVRINSNDMNSSSGCAVMRPEQHTLDLFNDPILFRKKSEISGEFISIRTDEGVLSEVDVIGSAHGEFVEPRDSTDTKLDRSILSGERIKLEFEYGLLRLVTCYDQAYSWYFPAADSAAEKTENNVSGDTIKFWIENEELYKVDVTGGAAGQLLSTTETEVDSTVLAVTDTTDYHAQQIVYSLRDSLITLKGAAKTVSKTVSLEAHLIELDTKEQVIEAFSASVSEDSLATDNSFAEKLQPNVIPVVLQDGPERILGDHLRYSIATQKGRIVTSKSAYETGYFYGDEVHRQSRDIYYLDDCIFSTCDLDEPHFHFRSNHLKLIEGNKLLARPVVLYIGRMPILAVPYYVFPLKKGRHSGILPFSLGNIEKGERYIRNVGYYWAASEYWDLRAGFDYYEVRNTLNAFGAITYNKRYCFDGSLKGNYAQETIYDYTLGREIDKTRWTLTAAHNHVISPSFRISATGHIQSDPSFYTDYSADLKERLNRTIRSQVNFTKKFGRSVSISGKVSHDDQLDAESRTDKLPEMSISLPAIHPFGSGSTNDDGERKRRWYNELIMTYRPYMINYSERHIRDSIWIVDTLFDTLITDTSILVDTTYALDTLSFRSRKEYARIDHSMRVSFPTKILSYLIFNPSFSYTENWYKIFQTDQSHRAAIDASTLYRAYAYDVGASLKTSLYGTVYPKFFGLVGLRQVITPSLSYRFRPKIDRHPEIRSYAGGGAGSTSRSQSVSLSLSQLYQSKVRVGEVERNFDLISVVSSVSYDFEKESARWSNVSTSFRSNLLPRISLYGSMVHNIHKVGSDDQLDILNPRLMTFSFNSSFRLVGRSFLFDDLAALIPQGSDSASDLSIFGEQSSKLRSDRPSGWDMSFSYSFKESGISTDAYSKSSFIRLSLNFNLTPTTRIGYSQSYDFERHKTINNQVNITKKLHCWTGLFHWVPIGSNHGWGFKLFVTSLPELKIGNSENSLSSSYFQSLH